MPRGDEQLVAGASPVARQCATDITRADHAYLHGFVGLVRRIGGHGERHRKRCQQQENHESFHEKPPEVRCFHRDASLSLAPELEWRNPQNPRGDDMARKRTRDIEKDYPKAAFVAKLRRLADAIENDERFVIGVAGERVYVPARAQYNIEHERSSGEEELEFQVKWQPESQS
jgi:amphi-Trp domain-containing protein